jgi:hypothetical protein
MVTPLLFAFISSADFRAIFTPIPRVSLTKTPPRPASRADGALLSLRRTLSGLTIDDLSKVRHKLISPIGFSEDREVLGKTVFVSERGRGIARGQQYLELGPKLPSLGCELNTIDTAGHHDIREQKVNVQ